MRDFFEDGVMPIAVIGGLLSVVLGGLLLILNWANSYSCGKYETVTGKQTKYVFMDESYGIADAMLAARNAT